MELPLCSKHLTPLLDCTLWWVLYNRVWICVLPDLNTGVVTNDACVQRFVAHILGIPSVQAHTLLGQHLVPTMNVFLSL